MNSDGCFTLCCLLWEKWRQLICRWATCMLHNTAKHPWLSYRCTWCSTRGGQRLSTDIAAAWPDEQTAAQPFAEGGGESARVWDFGSCSASCSACFRQPREDLRWLIWLGKQPLDLGQEAWGWWGARLEQASLEELLCCFPCSSEQRVPPVQGWLLPGSELEERGCSRAAALPKARHRAGTSEPSVSPAPLAAEPARG